ncbi:MAG: hypothetical protein ACE5L7_12370 [Candidatus Aminicenantales bacterium]
MKALIWILILALIGFAVYTLFLKPLSEEESLIKQLEKEYDTAVGQFVRAARTTAEIGMATVEDADDAIRAVKKVRKKLEELKKRLNEESAIQRARKLEAKIKEFYSKNDLIQ